MDWVRLCESKLRLLIQSLEKNQFISLVHINQQGYEEVKERFYVFNLSFKLCETIISYIFHSKIEESPENAETSSTGSSNTQLIYMTLWFIGLEFKLSSETTVDLDLTESIQSFTDKGIFIFKFHRLN